MTAEKRRFPPETLLALLVGLLVLVEPFRVPLLDPDEGRYAEIPREMLATGDWVIPHQNGLVYLEKPPLAYWLVAGSFRLFGETEAAARLPGKLATTGTMLALFLFLRRRAGERAGALAATFFGGSLLAFGLARIVLIDPILSAAQTAAVLCFAALAEGEGSRARERGLAVGFAAAAAAAVLLKGLVGVLLPGGAVVVWSLVTGRWRPFLRLVGPLPVVVFLLLAVPWHVLAARREPQFLSFYFVREHLERFLKPGHKRPGPPWYFLAVVAGGFLPFSPLLPRLRAVWPGRTREAWRSRPLEAFLWVWTLLVVVFFSVSKSKLIPYVLPVFPSLALLLALAVARREDGTRLRAGELWSVAAFLALLLVSGGVLASGALGIPGANGPAIALAAAAAVALALLLAAPRLVAGRELVVLAAGWTLFLAVAPAALPAFVRHLGNWPLAEALAANRRPGDVLVQRGDYVESLPFYAGQITPLSRIGEGSELTFGRSLDRTGVFQSDEEFASLWNGPKRVLAVVHRDLLKEMAAPGSALRPCGVLATARRGKLLLVTNDPRGTLEGGARVLPASPAPPTVP